MRLEVEDLRKRLEIADLMLQQVHLDTDKLCIHSTMKASVWDLFQYKCLLADKTARCHFLHIFTPVSVFISLQCSSQSDPTNANQQVQLLLGEKQQLETHNHQVFVQGPFS